MARATSLRVVFCLFASWLLVCGLRAEETATTKREGESRIEFLRTEIARHDELYHRHASPEIGDAEYDALKRELHALLAAYPEFGDRERTPVFDDRDGRFATARHAVPMRSLAKTYEEEGLRRFHRAVVERAGRANVRFVVEPKMDGIAISAVYEHGRLVRVVTRGNGEEGDDVTRNASAIASLRAELRADFGGSAMPERIELRGEVFMDWAEFERINRTEAREGTAGTFAHPRNLAVGSLKASDDSTTRERTLDVVFFGWGEWTPQDSAPATQDEFRNRVRAWGLPVPEPIVFAEDEDGLVRAVLQAGEVRRGLAFPTDGVVVKLDRVDARETLGEGSEGPRWAVAYKFPADEAATTLRDVRWQVGRSGAVTPVAEFDPVVVAGANVARASLYNPAWFARLGLHVGDTIRVARAGEIIPVVVGVDASRRLPGADAFTVPTACPSCAAVLSNTMGGNAIRCVARACPARVARSVEHFASDACLDIDGLGTATIERLVSAGLVRSPADLYALRIEDLETMGGLGANAARALVLSIERTRSAEAWRWLQGLGIPRVGATNARRLATLFPEPTELLHAITDEAVGAVLGSQLGAATAIEVRAWFEDAENREVFERLFAQRMGRPSSEVSDGPLAGLVFVFSGQLAGATRKEASARVKALGGETSGEVSRRTSHLVVGARPGASLRKAESLGMTILDEAAFERLLEAASTSATALDAP
ncbi:NAD-dependent DNA ligase LigA [Opitutales bacterium ASA1]|uniref:NAD-dependent DNA ligase LigA n=1 Tax=Congregicoccus parvus TaxID=3081749 RepID=UPI002B2EC65C|nr:NAD-dependent DNA ligase LigA [Opitutales bacterium ASA1]